MQPLQADAARLSQPRRVSDGSGGVSTARRSWFTRAFPSQPRAPAADTTAPRRRTPHRSLRRTGQQLIEARICGRDARFRAHLAEGTERGAKPARRRSAAPGARPERLPPSLAHEGWPSVWDPFFTTREVWSADQRQHPSRAQGSPGQSCSEGRATAGGRQGAFCRSSPAAYGVRACVCELCACCAPFLLRTRRR